MPVLMSNKQTFYAHRVGKYPIYNVAFTITDLIRAGKAQEEMTRPMSELIQKGAPQEDFIKLNKGRDFYAEITAAKLSVTTTIETPILSPGRGLTITLPYVISEKDDKLEYLINIFFRNGSALEIVKYRRIQGNWRMSFRVMKTEGGHPTKTLEEHIDPEIPIE